MTAATLREHLSRLDAALDEPVALCVYGSGALMLMTESRVRFPQIAEAVQRLPAVFRDDVRLRENLGNLRRDRQRWLP